MSRIIFVPQFPSQMRYAEWWFTEFPKQFKRHFDEVITLGEKYYDYKESGVGYARDLFSPVQEAIDFEHIQIEEYMQLKLEKDDILLHMDLSFPGFFHQVLHHKRPSKSFVFCHATAKNKYDYFYKTRRIKFNTELLQSRLYDGVFFGSRYSAEKLFCRTYDIKAYVVGLPEPPVIEKKDVPKIYNIVSVARPCIQKVNKKLEKKVARRYGPIIRAKKQFATWDQYSEFLSGSNILLITTKEDTFNYTILDAIKTGVVPIAPNKLCFPEILPREYLYDSLDELCSIIDKVGNGELPIPEIRCRTLVDSFYDNVCRIMKGE